MDLEDTECANAMVQALTIFYVPYILIDVPSNWVLKVIDLIELSLGVDV